ncbi:Sucrose nonfermenting 4-like protein [Vigna angularis]|uniref:Sucrose nonfermenting 4-like protein n=1 Tax=Phaseolus angularis TaxID=3914 RepID=A0A8T0KA76_PHAAN|nr:Sucrose nonfermenting 4-like protein [Vigna angularis]
MGELRGFNIGGELSITRCTACSISEERGSSAARIPGVGIGFVGEMFAPVADGACEGSGVSGSIMIPQRFVWPYGGRRVFLSGSFTRWSDHIAMSPMEGCPAVFQVVCNLMPGFHQYKFNVDGEWRHDEQQPSVSGSCGVVNTIYLVREPDTLPSILSNEAPGRSQMEIDNMEANSRMPVSDLVLSRQRISVFLSTHTAYDLLPESGKIIALDINLPVKQAFHVLYEQGVSMAPLWDFSRSQFVGVLSAMDFILILKELGNHGSNLTQEQLETHTIAAWKEGKLQLRRTLDSNGGSHPWRFVHPSLSSFAGFDSLGNVPVRSTTMAMSRMIRMEISLFYYGMLSSTSSSISCVVAGPHECLKDVALKILQNKVSTIPIIHSSSEDGSFPQLLHLASLSGILKGICRHFKHSLSSLPILQHPVGSIPLGAWMPKVGESNGRPLAMLRPSASLGAALSMFVQAEVSSIPVVDDNDSLLDIYSRRWYSFPPPSHPLFCPMCMIERFPPAYIKCAYYSTLSDITALAKDKAYARTSLEEISIHQALLLGQDANSPYGLYNGHRCHMCLRSDSLHKVMERLSIPGVRRLVVVEAGSKRVEGIISLSDVFRFLLG